MPTYDYECRACGLKFELFQKMTDNPVRACPGCKARRVKRLIGTGAGVIFKGSGFYQTDYRSHAYKQESSKEKGAVSSAAGTDAKAKTDGGKTDGGKSDRGKTDGVKSDGGKAAAKKDA